MRVSKAWVAQSISFILAAERVGLPGLRERYPLKDNIAMTGIQFVTDDRGRKVAVLIDLKKHGARLQDFWDGLISESRRKEKGIPLEKIKADLIKRGRLRG